MQRTEMVFSGVNAPFIDDSDEDIDGCTGWSCTHQSLLLCQKCGSELHNIMTRAEMQKHSHYEEAIMTISIEPCAKCIADAREDATYRARRR